MTLNEKLEKVVKVHQERMAVITALAQVLRIANAITFLLIAVFTYFPYLLIVLVVALLVEILMVILETGIHREARINFFKLS